MITNHFIFVLLIFCINHVIFCIKPIILSYFYKMIINKKKLQFVIWISKNRSKLNRVKLDWIGSFFKINHPKPNRTAYNFIIGSDAFLPQN